MDIDSIVALLSACIGSSVLAAFIGEIFSNRKNKYDRHVEFVTNGSSWRKEIITAACKLEKYNCRTADVKQLEVILQSLKLHLNVYGYMDRYSYEKDGHIWNEIELLQKAKDEKEFLKHRGLLLLELNLLLKNAWEYSKKVVEGKRFNAWHLLIIGGIVGFHTLFYFNVCGEDELAIFVVGVVSLSIYSFLTPSRLVIESFRKIKYRRRHIAINKLLRWQKVQTLAKFVQVALAVVLTLIFYFFTVLVGVLGVTKNYSYDVDSNVVVINQDSKLTKSISDRFEKERSISTNLDELYIRISFSVIAKKFSGFAYVYFAATSMYILFEVLSQRRKVEYSDYVMRLQMKENDLYIIEINELIEKLDLLANDEFNPVGEYEFTYQERKAMFEFINMHRLYFQYKCNEIGIKERALRSVFNFCLRIAVQRGVDTILTPEEEQQLVRCIANQKIEFNMCKHPVDYIFRCIQGQDKNSKIKCHKLGEDKRLRFHCGNTDSSTGESRYNYVYTEEIDLDSYKNRFNYFVSAYDRLLVTIRRENIAFENKIDVFTTLRSYHVRLGMTNDRILAQSGSFIIAGLDDLYINEGLRSSRTKQYARIIIEDKKAIFEELKLLNINDSTMLPDLQHTGDYMRDLFT